MIKHNTYSTLALLGLLAAAPVTFAAPLPTGLSITESLDAQNFDGSYAVALAADAGFSLSGFGVSNADSSTSIGAPGNEDECVPADGGIYCYRALNLDASNWDSETAHGLDFLTFEQVFGAFSDNVAPGEQNINWYEAYGVSGEASEMQPGQSNSDFFLFTSEFTSSIALGVTSDEVTGEFSFFSNAPLAPVPVPAAVWLFGSGLLGLIGMARRKKA